MTVLLDDKQNSGKVPDTIAGVDLNENILKEKYGDKVKEPAVYGGVDVRPEIREFLKLPRQCTHKIFHLRIPWQESVT